MRSDCLSTSGKNGRGNHGENEGGRGSELSIAPWDEAKFSWLDDSATVRLSGDDVWSLAALRIIKVYAPPWEVIQVNDNQD